MPTVPSLEKRDYVINELLETEKNYVDVLSSMQTNFMRPFANLLREDDYNVIFYGIKVCYLYHLRDCVIKHRAWYLLIYITFCNLNFDQINIIIYSNFRFKNTFCKTWLMRVPTVCLRVFFLRQSKFFLSTFNRKQRRIKLFGCIYYINRAES